MPIMMPKQVHADVHIAHNELENGHLLCNVVLLIKEKSKYTFINKLSPEKRNSVKI